MSSRSLIYGAVSSWAALWLAGVPCATTAQLNSERRDGKVVFVAASDAEPYAQALEGFRSVFPNVITIVLDPNNPLHTAALPAALEPPVSLVVAAGSDAVEAVTLSKTEAPMIATMVLMAARGSNTSRPPLEVHLDAAPSEIAAEIAEMFPGRHRIVSIWDPTLSDSASIAARFASLNQRAGIQIIPCKSPEELLPVFLSLRGKADFVVTRPNGSLYNATTVKPLILASLAHRLPIIGFSASFVRGGAAVGIYPDFRDIGSQTAALAQRFLAGQVRNSHEGPRTYVVAVNQRVLRLLGLEYRPHPGVVVFR